MPVLLFLLPTLYIGRVTAIKLEFFVIQMTGFEQNVRKSVKYKSLFRHDRHYYHTEYKIY